MRYVVLVFSLFVGFNLQAQLLSSKNSFTRADTLRGSLRPERTAFDMLKYDLNIEINPEEKFIHGYNKINFEVLERQSTMQLDLFENMQIDSIVFEGKQLKYKREHNAVFIDFGFELMKGTEKQLQFYYRGHPIEAKNAPWDGGFVFKKDKNGKHWIAVAVQGTGASLWYPNKDHQSDEPDSAVIRLSVPKDLMAVSNGKLIQTHKKNKDYTTYGWKVSYPINNYNITLNIGDYVNFSDEYQDLRLEYWVLSYNLDKAKAQFEQVKPMMACFYEKFGEYPFVKDNFKLVETPYLGMEHQSAVAYGNQYMNGYLGTDLSGTGIGTRFDFIIIHESGHEWFGNSISAKDNADLWIHEAFTTYTEAVFVECEYGKEDALDYIYGQRGKIKNDMPIQGPYGVNKEGSSDMYFKGANIINTLRTLVDNDELWWRTLKDFHSKFKYKTTDTDEVVAFFSKALDKDLTAFFDQYLNYAEIPKLVFRNSTNGYQYKWIADVEDFDMPIKVRIDSQEQWLFPNTSDWKEIQLKSEDKFDFDNRLFLVDVIVE
jgi:aminopeptidase N